jgi:hypothetical protein
MEGWHPERLPVLAAVYDAGDVEALITRLVAIRDAVNDAKKKRHAN